ncbi:MAG: superoxide dismutase family protein [Nocardiopsaceae bacterium]|nr:superoxide dismutase family protein [Nocardiopsaceae bacterium]
MPLTRSIIGLALPLLLIAGCTENERATQRPESPATEEDQTPQQTQGGQNGDNGDNGDDTELASVSETFQPYGDDVAAVTYDDAVPEGATVDVRVTEDDDGEGTEFDLAVDGLEPDRDYGAHLHTDPCGEDPDAAGPHYQNEEDPEQPSVNPEYANDDNEVWLDFETDSEGAADPDTDVDWTPREGEANSIVIHEQHTMTGEGEAGQAGDRLACVNVPL